jgi:hypothetical protein
MEGRAMNGSGIGTLILSIDLELDLEHQDARHHRRLDEARARLIELTSTLNLPATWAVADPALSVATEPILSASAGHEIAVLGDQAWLGTGCGRARLSRELARRFIGARNAGIAVSTLALRNVAQVLDLDLLIEHGVTAIRSPAVDTLSLARKIGAPPIRFGIWQPPPALQMPPRPVWWRPAKWLIRHELRRAIRAQSAVHLAVDARSLLAGSEQSLQCISNALRYAASKRDVGRLKIQTIQQLATQSLAERAASPSHSILRPAA